MATIGGIMDMDGFNLQKKFYCKELALLKIDEETAKSYQFSLPFNYKDLNAKDRRTVGYVIRNITKMPIFTRNSTPLEQLDNIVVDFYNANNQLPIAYKGGNIERRLLQKLNIPCINLEVYGCPKAELLFKDMVWIETCGFHIGKDNHLHCSKCEVEAYGRWWYKKMWEEHMNYSYDHRK